MASNLADGLDGIRKAGQYYIVSWRYEIFLVDQQGGHRLLLDTEETKDWNADMEFIKEKSILLVPTLLTNKLIAYRLQTE